MKRFLFFCFTTFFSINHCLFAGSYDHSYAPDVDINTSSERVLAWIRDDGVSAEVCVANYTSAGWKNPETVKKSTPGRLSSPQVVIDDSGNLIVAWILFMGKQYCVETATYSPKGGWGTVEVISNAAVSIRDLQLAGNHSGSVLAIWGENAKIQAASYQNGSWSSPTQLAPTGKKPQIALHDFGLAVWEQMDTEKAVYGAIWNGSSWSASSKLSPPGVHAYNPDVAMNGRNTGVVIWSQNSAISSHIAGTFFRSGVLETPVAFSPDGESALLARIAINDHDEVIAVWAGKTHGKGIVINAMSYVGGIWTLPETISSLAKTAGDPRLAIGSTGQAIATWKLSDPAGFNPTIHGATMEGGSWSLETQISATGDLSWDAEVAMNDADDCIISWSNITKSTVVETFTKP